MRALLAVFALALISGISLPAHARFWEERFGNTSPAAGPETPAPEAQAEEDIGPADEPEPVEKPKPAPKPAPKPKEKPKPSPKPEPKPESKPEPRKEEPVATPLPLSKPDADYVMLKVGSQDIPASEVQHLWEGLFPRGAAPDFAELKRDVRDRVLRGVVAERLLWQESLKQGLDKSETVQRDLEEIKRKMVVKALLDAKTADISDKELQSAYNDLVLSMKNEKEARARHILVASEKEAKDVQKSLESGKSFEEVARDYSKDPGSAKQGGDLGYFTKDKMVKEFADAVFGMKKGETSGPVKTSFGWHIIRLEDLRPVAAPTFHESRDALKARLQEKRLSDYVRTLVKQAEVKLYDASGKELPFNKDIGLDLNEAGKP